MEGWPPPFPDATVRGENENIRHGLWRGTQGTHATDGPKLTNGTAGLKYIPKYIPVCRLEAVGRGRGVAGHGACPCLMVARIVCRG